MDAAANPQPFSDGAFGPIHAIDPDSEHTHTAIMLHGRGSSGQEFAEELFETVLPGQEPLTRRLPGWRWVFPSSPQLWSTAFQESLPAWFEAHSLTDPTERQDLQIPGIRQSVAYIQSIVDDEIVRLGGKPERLVIAGISQGAAIGMWTLLCQGELNRRLLAFVGASTWLPFAECIERFLGRNYEAGVKEYNSTASDSDAFVEGMMSVWRQPSQSGESVKPLLSTPVFLGHGVDDAVVDVELGRKTWLVLTQIGFQVRWREYSGAESEGHWLKVPEEVDDIAAFLLNVTST